jgi:chemotaxis protein histidine kinase CheA
VGDDELLDMLAAEAQRRGPSIISGLEKVAASGRKEPKRIEALRVEAHGLKGAALVVGQERLAELARLMEQFLRDQIETGRIDPGPAAVAIAAASAFTEGAEAAAEGVGEPKAVGESIEALSR